MGLITPVFITMLIASVFSLIWSWLKQNVEEGSLC